MEVAPLSSSQSAPLTPRALGRYQASFQAKVEISATILTSIEPRGDSVDLNFGDLQKGLAITAKSIIERLNELLKEKLPDGISGLKPEDQTPEKTADRVVAQITSLFDAYSRSNPELSDEEKVERFIAAAKKGVQQGYDDAFEILQGLGAFEFDGVQSGVEQTKLLIDSKLEEFANTKRAARELAKPSEVK